MRSTSWTLDCRPMSSLAIGHETGPRLRPSVSRRMRILLLALGLAGWCLYALRTVQAIVTFALHHDASSIYLLDWRVYYSGAMDLFERDLYLDSGITVGNLPMPVDVFNYPPMSAALGVPLLPFGFEVGGLIWISLGALALGASAYLTTKIIGGRIASVVTGLLLLIYALQWNFPGNVVVGNVNDLVLLTIAGFVLAHLRGWQLTAGGLLGLAIAIKAWPVLLGIVLLREHRWRELAMAAAVLVGQGLIFLLWLGPQAAPAMVSALRVTVSVPPGSVLLWTSWARAAVDWWPVWGSVAVAILLILIPASGRLGMGLALIAGLTLIPNLWDHYIPTFAFALLLVALSEDALRTYGRVPIVLQRFRSQAA
jgi:hypothetical protein